MNQPEEKSDHFCPRCGAIRECNADRIHACACTTVLLTEPQRRYIGSLFTGCLCTACLNELKMQYESTAR